MSCNGVEIVCCLENALQIFVHCFIAIEIELLQRNYSYRKPSGKYEMRNMGRNIVHKQFVPTEHM